VHTHTYILLIGVTRGSLRNPPESQVPLDVCRLSSTQRNADTDASEIMRISLSKACVLRNCTGPVNNVPVHGTCQNCRFVSLGGGY
jgi:hypothetical protein